MIILSEAYKKRPLEREVPNMHRTMTPEKLSYYAYINFDAVKEPVRGVVVEFIGLGGNGMYTEDTARGKRFGEMGFYYVLPYLNPWNWMNDQAVRTTDCILDGLVRLHGEILPVISTGGSMGGQSALVYSAKSRHPVVACVANCPVCDLPFHYTERVDLPRTLVSAFGDKVTRDMPLYDVLKTASPLHLAQSGRMPDIEYTIFHCTADEAVNKQDHSDRFVPVLRKHLQKGFADYIAVPDRGHCQLTDEMWEKYFEAVDLAVDKM